MFISLHEVLTVKKSPSGRCVKVAQILLFAGLFRTFDVYDV